MPTPKPAFPAAFRQQMAELVRAGRGISDLAREFGCNASSIHAWVKAAGGIDGSGATSVDAPLSANERQELIASCAEGSSRFSRSATSWQRLRPGVYELVKANQAVLPVRALCKTLRVSHSGYYGWLDRDRFMTDAHRSVLREIATYLR